jgi:hypothetical protein
VTGSTRPTRRARDRRRDERGTVLVLAPALALVLVVLAAIAVDLALVHTTQRAANRIAASAADDAAGFVDDDRLQADGTVVIDRAGAERFARASIELADLDGDLEDLHVVATDTTVEIRARVRVRHLFLAAVPGAPDDVVVPVRARARLLP